MDDEAILTQINQLVGHEHSLREQQASGAMDAAQEQVRVARVEEALDQCWDLLRRRRALRASGEDPDQATARPVLQVEGYQQ